MNNKPIDAHLLEHLPAAAVSFFAVFSRFECSLKRAGYHNGDGAAKPNWTKFATTLGQGFFEEVSKAGIANKVINEPPKKQIVKDGYVDWQPTGKATNVDQLFVYVRRVRNNLFHGGKYPSGPVTDASRNQDLLVQSVAVLELALERAPDVASYFRDRL